MSEQSPTPDELQSRIAQLEAENRILRDQAESGPPPAADAAATPPRTGRTRAGWAVLSVCLVVLGCLLVPLSVTTVWAKATLIDTDRFVATYAPLAKDPGVQAYLVDQSILVINDNVDIDQLTQELIDGIKELGTGPRADAALDALQGPMARGMENLIRNAVTTFIESDAFAETWEQALRISHTQLMATMQGDPDALLKAEQDGTIGIQIGPIIEKVKQALVDRGITVAAKIPSVDKTIPIARSDQITTAQAGYAAVIALGTWLPWVNLLILAAGVLVARRRSRGLLGVGIGFAIAMVILMTGFAVGRAVVTATLPPSLVPTNVSHLIYDTATEQMRDTALAGLVLGIAVALVAWFAGPFRSSQQLRKVYGGGVGQLRRSAEDHGVSTGRVGEWLYAQRLLIRIVIAVVVAAVILLNRPLDVSTIVITGLVAIAVLIILSLVERPPGSGVDRAEMGAAVPSGAVADDADHEPTLTLPKDS